MENIETLIQSEESQPEVEKVESVEYEELQQKDSDLRNSMAVGVEGMEKIYESRND